MITYDLPPLYHPYLLACGGLRRPREADIAWHVRASNHGRAGGGRINQLQSTLEVVVSQFARWSSQPKVSARRPSLGGVTRAIRSSKG
jgi:hypothetical protein